MSRLWKPGDVAIAYDADWEFRVVRHGGQPDYWSAADGMWPPGVSANLLDYRPLVVIDPEDSDLPVAHAIWEALDDCGTLDFRVQRGRIRDALRSLIASPKPEEPMGLGAVVEDADGCRWMRWIEPDADHPAKHLPWASANGGGSDRRWDQIAAVRILSGGVA